MASLKYQKDLSLDLAYFLIIFIAMLDMYQRLTLVAKHCDPLRLIGIEKHQELVATSHSSYQTTSPISPFALCNAGSCLSGLNDALYHLSTYKYYSTDL